MSEPSAQPVGGSENARIFAIVCYGLFIAAFTNGITAIVGVVLAYIKRDEVRGTIWESHFTNLIRVFWGGLALGVLVAVLAVCGAFGIANAAQFDRFNGAVVLLPLAGIGCVLYVVWYLYHCIKGLMRALDGKAYG